RTYGQAGEVTWNQRTKEDRGAWWEMGGRLRNATHGEEIPAVFLYPKNWNGRSVVWLSDAGKSGLFANGQPIPAVRRLLDGGATVCGLDLLYQGEFVPGGQPVTRTRRVKNPREAAAYTFGYNRALFAQRVHDVLTALRFIRTHERPSRQVAAVALDPVTGPILAAALAVSGDAVDLAACDTHGFRFGAVADLWDVSFLPGGAKYGDLSGFLALTRTPQVWIAGEPSTVTDSIAALSGARVNRASGTSGSDLAAADWLAGIAL
ncbi:MAG: acetylxylan esterase, partial [Verrucomicrobia bacterium]|nr:acetylxylan esterase [Verrucomicrobiota bacterium]